MEFFNILKDIASGELPLSELPSFVAYLARTSAWFWFFVGLGLAVLISVL